MENTWILKVNNSQQIGNIQSLNSLVGGLATNATSLLMGGNANFNLLSYKGVGMLEFSFGKDGISSKIGMGGTNISYQNLVSAFGGATHLHVNRQIDNTEYDKTTQDALKSQYGYGDEQAKAQLDDIINGDTVLKFDAEGSEVAQSVTENGQKIIHINSTLNDGFIDLGLTLQHEAHRDGIVGDEQRQYIETVNAVEAHTKMAINMANDGLYKTLMKDIISNNQNLKDDIYLYSVSQAYQNENIFSDYVSNMYDSSNDYWKLLDDGILQKDGSGWLRDERGNLILNKYGQIIGATGEETGLLNIMYDGTSGKSYNSFEDYQKEHSYKLMSEMLDPYYEDGKEHTKENANWDKTVVANLNMTDLMEFAGDRVTVQVFTKYYDSTVDALYADQNKIDIGEVTLRGITDNAKERFTNFMQAKSEFYESAGVLVDNENTKITGQYKDYLFKDDGTIDITAYKNYNNKHYGIDIGRGSKNVSIEGSSILMGLSGKVILNYFDSRAGWSIHTNYGYLFEDSFINTGIFGEYDHMLNQSTVITNKFYDSDSVLGYVGNTGTASYGAHLHYSIYTIPNEYYSDSTMRILLGKNYLDSAMTNISGTKTVYDPTQLYINNRK